MAEKKLYIDEVYVIESLPTGERRTGRELYEDLVIMAIAANPPRQVHYKPLTTRQEFLGLLRAIAHDAQQGNHSPLLHIETHGCPDGIGLASGEFLAWADFKQELGWTDADVTKTFCHQVGVAHRRLLFETLHLDPAIDYPTVEFLGNMGSASLPITMALSIEAGTVTRAEKLALLGIGSGLNCMMLGVVW